nr:serine/threonine protein kinase SRPK1 [Tanacetum cinerariifolium]
DNKIDLLVQQYKQFTILEEEFIDSGFVRFDTIITSLKPIDEGFSSKNYVRKFLMALHPKWRAKVTDSEIYRGKKERVKSIALNAKKESSDDETSTSRSKEEEYAMAKGKSDRKCFRCGDPNHLIGDCSKPSRNKDQKAFIGDSLLMMESQWSHTTPEWSRFMTIVKQNYDSDTVSYHKLFDILKQYQKEVKEIRADRIAKSANPLALVAAAQQYPDNYYPAPKPQRSYAPSPKQSFSTRSNATTRNKGKEIAKPVTPLSELEFDEDSDPEQAQKIKECKRIWLTLLCVL